MKKIVYNISGIILLLMLTVSCATVKGWFSHDSKESDSQEQLSHDSVKTPTKEDYLQDLQQIIKTELKSAAIADKNTIYRKKPYFWKYYSIYVNTDEPFNINLQETDSKSKPYIAKIELEKTMYYTKLHKTRRDAEEDSDFIRSVGKETITYELRNGRWTKIGSVFVPEKTEKKSGDNWVPLREEEIQKEQPEEPKKGVLKRIRDWIL
ncbi:MAG TPA: hypothetical protein PLX23_09640 [Candidatus Hydrogenedens sp.]|nr:hypothetical protein [Candidatus Hydrogenedens sp.]